MKISDKMNMYKYYETIISKYSDGFLTQTKNLTELLQPGAYSDEDELPFHWDGCVKRPFFNFGELMDYLEAEAKAKRRGEKIDKLFNDFRNHN